MEVARSSKATVELLLRSDQSQAFTPAALLDGDGMKNKLKSVRTRSCLLPIACFVIGLTTLSVAGGPSQLALEIADYVALPITGLVDGKGQTDGMLARINGLREEPGGANRFFIYDLNGPVNI